MRPETTNGDVLNLNSNKFLVLYIEWAPYSANLDNHAAAVFILSAFNHNCITNVFSLKLRAESISYLPQIC
jgi:hypothetical protein